MEWIYKVKMDGPENVGVYWVADHSTSESVGQMTSQWFIRV